jgi:phage terminase large subunit-like protein
VVIFAANDNDDPADEATWRKANPSLGLSPTLHYLRLEYLKAAGNPRALAHFKCYHLGIWADEQVRWLPLKKWDACAATKDGWRKYAETLKGRKCFAAFDVSATTDITALVLLFPPTDEDPHWRVLCRFWIPADQVERRVAEGAPIEKFLAAGAMETTEGDYVDQNVVGLAILEAARDYDVQKIGYDPWNAAKLYTDLTRDSGIEEGVRGLDVELFQEMRQGIRTLGEPSKNLERLVFAGVFDHGGHPVLRWMAGNTVVHFDRNLNFMPAKDRSSEKIDGIVGCVMAVGLAITGEDDVDLDDYVRSLAA